MNPIQAIVLGIVQGLTEFIPVSSSAHLIIVPWILGWPDPGLAFDAALHLGTLAAVLVYFASDWLALAKGLIASVKERRVVGGHYRLLPWLILAAIVLFCSWFIPGLLDKETKKGQLPTYVWPPGLVVGIGLIVYAVLGTSRPLSVTTSATLAIMTAGVLGDDLAHVDGKQARPLLINNGNPVSTVKIQQVRQRLDVRAGVGADAAPHGNCQGIGS